MSSTSTSMRKGYVMRRVKYQPHYMGKPMSVVGESGSPSYAWALLRAHLGHNKHFSVSELKLQGYSVKAMHEPPIEVQSRPHFVDKVADILKGIQGHKPTLVVLDEYTDKVNVEFYDLSKPSPDWSFWIGLAAVITVGLAIGWFTYT